MGSRNERLRNLSSAIGALLLLVLTAFSADTIGRGSREVLPERRVVEVAVPERSYEHWRRAGVRGRVLYHFARRISVGDAPEVEPGSYVRHAIREGVVREIVHVVPRTAWEQVSSTLARRGARRAGEAYRLHASGVPLLVTHSGGIPPPHEPVLVNLDRSAFAAPELEEIDAFLARVPADLVVVRGAGGAP